MARELRRYVEDAVETEIQACDFNQMLRNRDYDKILVEVADELCGRLSTAERWELNEGDRAFIADTVSPKVQACLDRPFKPRFAKFDRVVCKIGGQHGWAPGTIQSVLEEDPSDVTGQTKLPYVVKLDPPIGRLISVPYDETSICRPEVCFGRISLGDLGFTVRCKPKRDTQPTRRFGAGDRVACAVEDDSGEYTLWAAGNVVDVNYDVQPDATAEGVSWEWGGSAGVIPYRVLLDNGVTHVYVHRDVHWLVRDLALQPAGPRQSEDGTRDLKRLVKRRRPDSAEVELIDHMTRRVRVEAARDNEDSSDDDD